MEETVKRKVGRPVNERAAYYMRRFGVNKKTIYPFRDTGVDMLDRLDHCADDAARRILLGVSEKEEA